MEQLVSGTSDRDGRSGRRVGPLWTPAQSAFPGVLQKSDFPSRLHPGHHQGAMGSFVPPRQPESCRRIVGLGAAVERGSWVAAKPPWGQDTVYSLQKNLADGEGRKLSPKTLESESCDSSPSAAPCSAPKGVRLWVGHKVLLLTLPSTSSASTQPQPQPRGRKRLPAFLSHTCCCCALSSLWVSTHPSGVTSSRTLPFLP